MTLEQSLAWCSRACCPRPTCASRAVGFSLRVANSIFFALLHLRPMVRTRRRAGEIIMKNTHLKHITALFHDQDVCAVADSRDFPNATCAAAFVQSDGVEDSFVDYASAFSTFSFAFTTHTALPPILQARALLRAAPRLGRDLPCALAWCAALT